MPRQYWPVAPIVVLRERIDRGNCFDSREGLGMDHHERGGPLRSACMRATQIAHYGDIQSDGAIAELRQLLEMLRPVAL